MAQSYFVYILASETRELYVGVANDLQRRLAEHRHLYDPESYSARHHTIRLVYFETSNDVLSAIRREKEAEATQQDKKASSDRTAESRLA
jgi:putative endonuclease